MVEQTDHPRYVSSAHAPPYRRSNDRYTGF